MSGRFLLDTNIVIALLNGDRHVETAISGADEIFLSSIVAGELYFGAAKSGRPEANRAVIDEFMRDRVVLPCDLPVGREYGRLKSSLKARGTPLPENDIWVAAIALHHGLTVASRDGHFRSVVELTTVSWQA